MSPLQCTVWGLLFWIDVDSPSYWIYVDNPSDDQLEEPSESSHLQKCYDYFFRPKLEFLRASPKGSDMLESWTKININGHISQPIRDRNMKI